MMLIKRSVINLLWFSVFISCLYVSKICAQVSPCPDVFSYVYDNDNSIVGRVVVANPSFGVHKLSIAMSVKALLNPNYVGQITLLNKEDLQHVLQNGGYLNYKVSLAIQNPLPVITSITFSGRQLCRGYADLNLAPGEHLSSLELHHTLRAELSPSSIPINSYTNEVANIPASNSYPNIQTNVAGLPQSFDYTQPGQNNYPKPAPALQNSVPSHNTNYGDNNWRTTAATQQINKNQYTTEQPAKQPNQYWSYTGTTTKAPSWYTQSTTPNAIPWAPPRTTTTFRQWTTTPSTSLSTRKWITTTARQWTTTTTTQAPSRVTKEDDNEVCGVSSFQTVNLIYYGDTTFHGEWPWIVAIFQKRQSGINFICSGTLVSNTVVVTAAHCTFDKPRAGKKVKADTFLLRIGVHNVQNWEDDYGKVRGVKEVIYPPDFSEYEPTDIDLAILVLRNPIQYSRYIKPICLWSGENIQGGLNGSVVGWGRDEAQNIAVPEPRRTIVPLVTREQCISSNKAFIYLLNEHKFCAGNRDGSGPCNGDSGGGLYVYRDNHFELKGIVSSSLSDPGTGSCDLAHYVLYADAAKLADWMKNIRWTY